MKLSRSAAVGILALSGGILPLLAFRLAAGWFPGFDMALLYLPAAPSILPQVSFTLPEQVMVCVASFGLKPLYEIVSLVLIIRLWRHPGSETVALRYGLLAFFLGENACALNYLLFEENSYLLEYFHIYGMLVCFSFVSYAVLRVLDKKIIKYTVLQERCSLLFFCRQCYKHHSVSCTVRRLYQLFIVGCAIMAFIPLTAALGGYHVVGDVFGTAVVFGHSLAQQILENRVWPLGAVLCLTVSFVVLQRRKETGFETAKSWLSAGLGLLGFSLMRFFVFSSFKENPIWADIWEELTESLFVFAVYFLLFMSRMRREKRPGLSEK